MKDDEIPTKMTMVMENYRIEEETQKKLMAKLKKNKTTKSKFYRHMVKRYLEGE